MNKKQKLAIAISSGFMVVILGILSLVSSANSVEKTKQTNLTPDNSLALNQASGEVCEERNDFHEYNPDTNTWSTKAPFFPGNRISAVAFSIGANGYIATGEYELNNTTVYTNDLWRWNGDVGFPNYNTWTQMNSLPGPARAGAVGFSIHEKAYIGTGGDANGSMTGFYEWDSTIGPLGTWTQKAPFGGTARTAAVGFSIGAVVNGQDMNKGYIGTGITPNGLAADFWEWDQHTDTWSAKNPFTGGARDHAVGFAIGNKGYIGTGKTASGYKNDFYEWDKLTNTWSSKANFPGSARLNAVGFSADTKGYVGTGLSLNGKEKDFWEFDPTGGISGLVFWTQKADYSRLDTTDPLNPITIPMPTDQAVGFSIRNTGYIGTGFRCEQAPPVACTPNSWNKKADFTGSGRWQAEGLPINGKGYIGMGTSSTIAALKDFYEWDPAGGANGQGSWTQRTGLATGRADPVAFSINGKGYMGTGGDGNNAFYKDFWEFDPAGGANGSWTQKASLPAAAQGRRSAVGFSIGTKGYIGTGVNDNLVVPFLNDFYEWNQATNTWSAKASLPATAPPRAVAVGFSIGTKGYMGTGADYSTSYKDFWEFDPNIGSLGKWTQKVDVPLPNRGQAAGFSLVGLDGNTYGYIGTGARNNYPGSGSALNDFWRFNPSGNTTGWPAGSGLWEKKADYAGGPRINAAGFSLNKKGYIGTGVDNTNGTNYTQGFWEYCPD